MSKRRSFVPPLGREFTDTLQGLHQVTLTELDDETAPFVLPVLIREYLAYALAVYYRCKHCKVYHKKAIDALLQEQGNNSWKWKQNIVRAVLYLRISHALVSEEEWEVWLGDWRNFGANMHLRYPRLACYMAFAIGTARDDVTLITLAFRSLARQIDDREELKSVIRDIRRVVAFMKAAISVYRTEPLTEELFSELGTP